MTTPLLSPPPSAGRPERDLHRGGSSLWPAAVAGAVGTALALGLAEVVAGLAGRSIPSPVVAIGDAVVDLTPGPAVRTGIDTLGTADKPFLLVGIVAVTLLIGAALATGAGRRPQRLLGGLVGLVVVATWAASREPGASTAASAWAYLFVGGIGAAVTLGLIRAASRPAHPMRARPAPQLVPGRPPSHPSPASPSSPSSPVSARSPSSSTWSASSPSAVAAAGPPTLAPSARSAPAPAGSALAPHADPAASPDRRAFLALAGGVAVVAAVSAVGGRRLEARSNVAAARRALVLPTAAGSSAGPGTGPAIGFADVRGLSPFVTPNNDFYRIDTALVVPQVDPASWRLRVTGMVDEELSLTFDDLGAMSVVEQQVTLSCVSNEVGGDLVGNANWRGVPLADVLARAGVGAEATQVVGETADGFTAGFPLSVALDGRPALVALGMNGEVLPVAHGFPCRLVVAGLYGYVSATKWLTELRLNRWEDEDGYWIPRGWSKEGPIKTQSRIDVPRQGMELPAGTVAVAGVAWAPTRGISAVEVRVDSEPWQPAELSAGPSDATWVQWLYRWPAPPGRHRLTVRATDGDGAIQPAERSDVAPDGATGHHSIEVTVA